MPTSVLLVSKDRLTLEAITYRLEIGGYVVVPVDSPAMAYSCFDSIIFDTVLVETSLDDPDITFLAYDAKAYQPCTKVILIGKPYSVPSSSFFIDRFIQKPYNLVEIDEAMQEVIGSAAKREVPPA